MAGWMDGRWHGVLPPDLSNLHPCGQLTIARATCHCYRRLLLVCVFVREGGRWARQWWCQHTNRHAGDTPASQSPYVPGPSWTLSADSYTTQTAGLTPAPELLNCTAPPPCMSPYLAALASVSAHQCVPPVVR